MTGGGHPRDEPEIRAEVVQAVFSALIRMDTDTLIQLEAAEIGITAAERAQAEDLYAASLRATQDQRARWLEAVKVLTAGSDLSRGGSSRPGETVGTPGLPTPIFFRRRRRRITHGQLRYSTTRWSATTRVVSVGISASRST